MADCDKIFGGGQGHGNSCYLRNRWYPGAVGGCQVVIAHKMKVLESLGKGVFGPLSPRGGVGGDPPPILGCIGPLGAKRGVGGILPPL